MKNRLFTVMRYLGVPTLAMTLGALAVTPAYSQSPDGAVIIIGLLVEAIKNTRGVRVGVSGTNPNQVYAGFHMGSAPGARRLQFRPNFEVGVGEGVTSWTLNGEVAYFTPVSTSWAMYYGSGPSLNIHRIRSASVERTDTGLGINALFGIARRRTGMFAEVKGGFLDSPNLKIGIGYTFR